jgi:spore germination protein GerM
VTPRRAAAIVALTCTAAGLASALFIGLPLWYGRPATDTTPPAATVEAPERKIQVQLFYVSEDGRQLTSVEREVSFKEDAAEQAKAIINAQLAPASPPLVSALPPGTTLRALFLNPDGEAYVDLSRELSNGHGGGSTHELLTIYTVVHALTVNLPTIHAVQLLVEGREVDVLAGHINLRHPVVQNLDWVQ